MTSRGRQLIAFALSGALLFGARRFWETRSPDTRTLVVKVSDGASPEEVERAIDDAILFSLAVRSGHARRDPAVVDRLVRNMRFADPRLEEAQALERAIALDMHRSDPVVRQRLIWLARETIARVARTDASDTELASYLEEHAARFRRPTLVSFEHVFVSRERDGFEQRVEQVSATLAGGERPASDTSLLPARMTRTSPARIDALFGKGFAERVLATEDARWSEAIRTPFGAHFVRITERSRGALPPLKAVREKVRHEHERDAQPARVREALARMRAAYRVVVQPTGERT